jgi:hypothetical protein
MSLILSGTDGLSDVDGSAATPAIRGTDANTGMFFPAADTIAFSEGGVESMRIDSAGNMGIGVSNPTSRLSIAGGSLATGNYNLNIATGLTTGRAGTYGTGSLSAIHTYFDETSVEMSAGSSNGWVSAVSVTGLTGANYAGTVRFSTVSAERMRIDSAGQVGIGTSSPAYILDISGNTAGLVTTRIINLNSGASAYSYLRMGNNADSDAGILRNSSTNTAYGGAGSLNLYQGGARSIGFVTDNVERMRINAGAPILCLAGGNTSATGTGIAFPGTQSASSDANTLDDYEEGTFTATVNYDGGSFTAESGVYTKIGRAVTISIAVGYNAGAGTGNTLRSISGLPFTNANVQGAFGGLLYNMNSTTTNTVSFTGFQIAPGQTYIDLYLSQWGGNEGYLRFANTGGYFRVSVTYQT